MLDSLLQFPHIGYLSLALILLINAFYSKRLIFQLLALGIMGFVAVRQLTDFTEAGLLHTCVDLLLIALLALPAKVISARIFQIVYFFVALVGLSFFHTYYNKIAPIPKHYWAGLDPQGELLVQFSDVKTLNQWIQENENEYVIEYPVFKPKDGSYLLDEYIMIDVHSDSDIAKIKDQLLAESAIVHVENNELMELKLPETNSKAMKSTSGQNDPLKSNQWMASKFNLDDFHKKINAHSLILDAPKSQIVILDTGIDSRHEDLRDNYLSINRTYDTDPKGHGTHCAGIAGAVTGNNIGIASWLPPGLDIKISGIKVLNFLGTGTQRSIISGMIEAADLGASVISISIGGVTSDERERAYEEAVKYCTSKGSIVVIAAGNSNIDARQITPANIPGVIAVTAINDKLDKAFFGNTVDKLEMGLAAPGQDILSTMPNNKYKTNSGTSMAAPFVSGVIGLMKYFDPALSANEAWILLRDTSIKQNGLYIVDPMAALDALLDSSLEYRPQSVQQVAQ